MFKPEIVMWWAQWDKSGRLVRALYRPRDPMEGHHEPSPTAPAPELPKLRRGGVVATQGDLPL